VTIRGQRQYLWRAVDQDGDVIDILLQPRGDRHAAARFFRRLLKRSCRLPRRLVTDRFGSYRAAHRLIMPSVVHDTTRYANNRAEVSHQPTRRRENHMRHFKSAAQAQRFLAVHDVVRNLLTVGRHRLRAGHQRLLRARAFITWNAVAVA
jgi:putative transposase